jgi:hypothetical protein
MTRFIVLALVALGACRAGDDLMEPNAGELPTDGSGDVPGAILGARDGRAELPTDALSKDAFHGNPSCARGCVMPRQGPSPGVWFYEPSGICWPGNDWYACGLPGTWCKMCPVICKETPMSGCGTAGGSPIACVKGECVGPPEPTMTCCRQVTCGGETYCTKPQRPWE